VIATEEAVKSTCVFTGFFADDSDDDDDELFITKEPITTNANKIKMPMRTGTAGLVRLTGAPQAGQLVALELIARPQSLHLISLPLTGGGVCVTTGTTRTGAVLRDGILTG
jgi:hypothetical protein